jgi:hypothetical protein
MTMAKTEEAVAQTEATETSKATVVHESRDEALANKPEDAGMKLFRVSSPDGEMVRYSWAKWGATAMLAVVRQAGWKSESEGKAPDKGKVADLLSRLSEEDRAELLASYENAYPKSKRKK